MSRAGIFASAHVPAAAGGAVFQGSAYDETDGMSYTFAAQPIGAASASRRVILTVGYRSLPSRYITSITIGGVAATIDAIWDVDLASKDVLAVASAVVSTGTTADVVVTITGGNAVRCMIGVWTVEGRAFTGESDAATTDPASLTLDTATGDVIIAAAIAEKSQTVTWTGVTGQFFTVTSGNTRMAGADGTASGASTTVEASRGVATGTWDVALAAVYR